MSHNPMALLAIELKEKGFDQTLTMHNYVYLTRTMDYSKFNGTEITDDFVKVPDLASLVSALTDINYSLNHEYIDGSIPTEKWTLTDSSGVEIIEDVLWKAMAKYWILKKGA